MAFVPTTTLVSNRQFSPVSHRKALPRTSRTRASRPKRFQTIIPSSPASTQTATALSSQPVGPFDKRRATPFTTQCSKRCSTSTTQQPSARAAGGGTSPHPPLPTPQRRARLGHRGETRRVDGHLLLARLRSGNRTPPFPSLYPRPQAGYRPSRYLPYNAAMSFSARVDRVLAWMDLPPAQRPRFLAVYFEQPDHDVRALAALITPKGHEDGPASAEVGEGVAQVDAALGRLLDGLAARNATNSTDVVIVSDHGMTEIGPRIRGGGSANGPVRVGHLSRRLHRLERRHGRGLDPRLFDLAARRRRRGYPPPPPQQTSITSLTSSYF